PSARKAGRSHHGVLRDRCVSTARCCRPCAPPMYALIRARSWSRSALLLATYETTPWVAGHHVSRLALCSPPSTPLRVFVVTGLPVRRALTAAARSAGPRHL